MSGTHGDLIGDASADDRLEEVEKADLVAGVEALAAENERLRESYARARQSSYRRTAAGFALLGLATTGGAVLFPDVRTVLLAFGGTGLFAALLTLFVTPERFVAATVGEGVYEALASDHDRLVSELGLADHRLYVPADGETVRLFVPQHEEYAVPDAESLGSLFVAPEDPGRRGVAFRPTGESLFREFERALQGGLPTAPAALAAALAEGVTEQFEIADGLDADVEAANGRATVSADGGAYGDLSRFDNPVVSLFAVGFARGLDRPVSVELSDAEGTPVATLRWETDGGGGSEDRTDR